MKRGWRPPEGAVRRVQQIDRNIIGTAINNSGDLLQRESGQEYDYIHRLLRELTVRHVGTQCEKLRYVDDEGVERESTPDIRVERTDGSVEYHEVTRSERYTGKTGKAMERRDDGRRRTLSARGEKYVVIKEDEVPGPTEAANLMDLIYFRPRQYADARVIDNVRRLLPRGEKRRLIDLVDQLTDCLGTPRPEILATVHHLLWHRVLDADLCAKLLFVHDRVSPAAIVWRGERDSST